MPASPRILVLYSHPASHRSRVNRPMAEAARSVPNVQVHDLYETYPDFHIDVEYEQRLLADADLVVFQHPIQWYSMPALPKEWVDVVFQEGWAYGPGGTALQNKDYWLAATTGGTHESYQDSGPHRRPFSAFLPQFEQTAELCGMRWLPPHILHDAHRVDDAAVAAHIETYRERLATYPHWPELAASRNDASITRNQSD
ncbi:MAG TPA: NAD(P)H-dependent oxidoreductase [Burkholderiaceae bacterium]|jgi:glutathione-regulated potassium-efflux system ancillary protein KefF|nr:NAD(P)H-dependent oxidoreductase [Burkholderiaceae bacterium]